MAEDKKISKESNIAIKVGLDANNMPTQIHWKAEDSSEVQDFQACKAMLLAFFDKKSRDTLKIDLWTQEMQVIEMDKFFYQTLKAMTDTYIKATQNIELANEMRRFVEYFGEKTEVISNS